MKGKKLLAVLLVLAMAAVGFTGCAKEQKADSPEATTPTPAETADEGTEEATPTPTEAPRDLGAIDILVADWFTSDQEELKTQKQEDQKAYREQLMQEHNFTLTQKNIASWAEYQEIFITSTMSGAPVADVFVMDLKFVPEPMKQGLLYPVSDLSSFNFDEPMWNQAVRKNYEQNGKVYGFSEVMDTPGLGVFWNKRLFQEAGLDPDLLYDLQASGEWTWEKFHELAKLLTKDSNNDGVPETYGITTWQREIVKAAVFSNGSDYVKFNETTGKYENNQKSDEVLAAIKFAVDLFDEGLIAPKPTEEGSDEIKFFVDSFKTGQGAMCPTEWYRNGDFSQMEDDWGFVFFPKGPGANAKMQTMYVGNIRVMPSSIDPSRADDVAFAYSKWYGTVPGYEDDLPINDYYSQARDARTVEETLKPMLEGQGVRSLVYMIPGLSFKDGANEDNGGLANISAIEIADAASAIYDSTINDFYSK